MEQPRPHLVFKKSEHARWKLPAHHGVISAMHVRAIAGPEGGTPVVFTASVDGHFKVWDGRDGRLLSRTKVSEVALTCMAVSDKYVFVGDQSGYIYKLDDSGRSYIKWKAHRSQVTCLQAVNEERVFSGSLDCTVKLFSRETDIIRQFPANPEDCNEGILQLQVLPCNLLITGSTKGVIRVYNMRQDLLKVLKTNSLQGNPLNHMQALVTDKKIAVFCGSGEKLVMWYLTLESDQYGDPLVIIEAVRAITGRIDHSYISSMKPVFANPLYSKQPAAYLGTNSGYIHLYIPTTKVQPTSNSGGFRVEAQKFKSYTFKDAQSRICCVGVGCGRVFAGTQSGHLLMWKEPLNMLKLRAVCRRQSDAHTFKASAASRASQQAASLHASEPEPEEPEDHPSPDVHEDEPLSITEIPLDDAPLHLPPGAQPQETFLLDLGNAPSAPVHQPGSVTYLGAAAQPHPGAGYPGEVLVSHPAVSLQAPTGPVRHTDLLDISQSDNRTNHSTAVSHHLGAPVQHSDLLGMQYGPSAENSFLSDLVLLQGPAAVSVDTPFGFGSFSSGHPPGNQGLDLLNSFPSAPSRTPLTGAPRSDLLDVFSSNPNASDPTAANPLLFSLPSVPQSGNPASSFSNFSNPPGTMSFSTEQSAPAQTPATSSGLNEFDFFFKLQVPSNQPAQAHPVPSSHSGLGSHVAPTSAMSQSQAFHQFETVHARPVETKPAVDFQQFAQANLAMFQQESKQMVKPAVQNVQAGNVDELRCIVCLDKEQNAALYGCGHACVCYDCGQQLVLKKQSCPLCRAEIRDCLKLFR